MEGMEKLYKDQIVSLNEKLANASNLPSERESYLHSLIAQKVKNRTERKLGKEIEKERIMTPSFFLFRNKNWKKNALNDSMPLKRLFQEK
jgi:hypothetical protein